MSFKDRLKAAGFVSKRQFAIYAELAPNTVSRWEENPPKLVELHLAVLAGKEEAIRYAVSLDRENLIKMISADDFYKGTV